MHFIVPLFAGFLLWLGDRKMFRQFAVGILLLSYLGYFTYLVFPAAPPWMAAQAGLLPPVTKILNVTFAEFRDPVYLPTLYSKLRVNLVAAVPSLHAAYPLLVSLFIGEKLPKLWPLMGLYVFSVWLAIIYLGEHYVFDVLLGAFYAGAVYALVAYWPAILLYIARRKVSMEAASDSAMTTPR
jgi:PAP2 superfamily